MSPPQPTCNSLFTLREQGFSKQGSEAAGTEPGVRLVIDSACLQGTHRDYSSRRKRLNVEVLVCTPVAGTVNVTIYRCSKAHEKQSWDCTWLEHLWAPHLLTVASGWPCRCLPIPAPTPLSLPSWLCWAVTVLPVLTCPAGLNRAYCLTPTGTLTIP